MSETRIEWTDATWNPVAGCSRSDNRLHPLLCHGHGEAPGGHGVEKYAGLTRRSGKRIVWNGVVKEDTRALYLPHTWKKPRKIFVNSMSDLFHERVSDTS